MPKKLSLNVENGKLHAPGKHKDAKIVVKEKPDNLSKKLQPACKM